MLTLAHTVGEGAYWLGPLIFFGIIILFWALAARRWRKHGWAHHGHWKSAGMRILEERYAKGEIERSEFFDRKKDLQPPPER